MVFVNFHNFYWFSDSICAFTGFSETFPIFFDRAGGSWPLAPGEAGDWLRYPDSRESRWFSAWDGGLDGDFFWRVGSCSGVRQHRYSSLPVRRTWKAEIQIKHVEVAWLLIEASLLFPASGWSTMKIRVTWCSVFQKRPFFVWPCFSKHGLRQVVPPLCIV